VSELEWVRGNECEVWNTLGWRVLVDRKEVGEIVPGGLIGNIVSWCKGITKDEDIEGKEGSIV